MFEHRCQNALSVRRSVDLIDLRCPLHFTKGARHVPFANSDCPFFPPTLIRESSMPMLVSTRKQRAARVVSGKGAASPAPPPLRTVRESCPSYGSSRPLPSVLPEALSRMGRCVASRSVCSPIAGSHLTCAFGLHNPPGSYRVVYPAHVSRLSA